MSSDNPGIAHPVAATIVMPQSVKSETIQVHTTLVGSKTPAKLTATANGTGKSKLLSVISAASATPTSIAFGNQAVGAQSSPRSVMVFNKGAVNYSISSITVGGSHLNQFVPTSSCPAILPAGSSCEILVRFTPFSTGKKAAQLNVAVSAKDVPLVVKLTGTGVAP